MCWQWNADITSRHTNTGNTVLHASCGGGHVDIVKFLMTAYNDRRSEPMDMFEDLSVNRLNFDGITPLMLAAERGNYFSAEKTNFIMLLVKIKVDGT